MATWVFCNRCFQPPRRTACFSLTSCGHVYCAGCLSKCKKDECLICKVPCHTVLLSKHTDSGIQALFAGIDSLCKKYSKETSQISEFQEKHRKRLLAFYREKISKLEDALRKSVLQMEQLHSMRPSQETVFSTIKHPVSTPSAKPDGCLFLPPDSPASERLESMDVDLTPSPRRRPEIAAGPTRISLISPPRDGRMGSVSHRGPQHLSLTPSHASVSQALRIASKGPAQSLGPQAPGRAGGGGSPSLGGHPGPAPRPPISLSGLLQRQHLGSAGLGAAALERRPVPAHLCGSPALQTAQQPHYPRQQL
ncbi:probable E3 SUMO-protein ligase RNF212 [Rhinolophus ferrumequinum]|uniref:probable E3 SUMO-protein ligase RNF212 n=1 Tax=Rhinolophus ferrumequinum TaxID=59479 RepID=UPI00140F8F0E|nr:probable E3 SUMO-protein ligase RNF212 [Rhinolophus ferrumequinum]